MESQERRLTREELSDFILKASALQDLEDEVKRQRITDLVSNYNGDLVSVPVAYEIAEGVGIAKSYFERALRLSPDREQKVIDLKGLNSYPSIGEVIKDYKETLDEALLNFDPLSEFSSQIHFPASGSVDYLNFFKKKRKLKPKKLFGRFRTPKVVVFRERLARFSFINWHKGPFTLEIDANDPIFLRACSQTLKDLNEKYKEFISDSSSLRRDYPIRD